MMKHLLLWWVATRVVLAADSDGFVPLFNDRDLTGWVNVNCAPETWTVRQGVIHCTGRPIGTLRTDRQYENFILELEWRHLTRGGNSGVFIWGTPIAAPGSPFLRGIEVQVLDHGYTEQVEKQTGKKPDWFTTHGDVFPVLGATMKPFGRHRGMRSFPSEERSKPSPEWNHYRIICSNGVIRLHVNGREVSGGEDCNYRKGYLALESEEAPVEFRNIRLRELPSSGVPPEMTAPLDPGWRTLFTGLDLRGWQTNAATASRWQVIGGRIALKPDPPGGRTTLWTEASFGNAEFLLDCRPAKSEDGRVAALPSVWWGGVAGHGTEIRLLEATPGEYQRYLIAIRDRELTVRCGDRVMERRTLPQDAPQRGKLGLGDHGHALEFTNLYVRD